MVERKTGSRKTRQRFSADEKMSRDGVLGMDDGSRREEWWPSSTLMSKTAF